MWASAIRAIPDILDAISVSQHEYKLSLSLDEILILLRGPMELILHLLNLIDHFSSVPC